jgi:sporulation protein YlmC with PRC-barrel domain
MCKPYVGAWLVASLLVAGPASAQTSSSQPLPEAGTANAGPAAPKSPVFLEMRQPDQFRSTNLRGTRVYGANNENIGEINDVLINRSGQVAAVIIGVGGFLGIGEKDVAVPMSMLLFQPGAVEANSITAPPTGSMVSPSSPATDAQSGTTTVPSSPTTGAAARHDTGIPDRLILKMTKEQLQNAPAFKDNIGDSTLSTGEPSRATPSTPPVQKP